MQHGGDRRHDNRDHTESECSMEETGGMATEITQRVSAAWRRQEAWTTEITQRVSAAWRRQEAWQQRSRRE